MSEEEKTVITITIRDDVITDIDVKSGTIHGLVAGIKIPISDFMVGMYSEIVERYLARELEKRGKRWLHTTQTTEKENVQS